MDNPTITKPTSSSMFGFKKKPSIIRAESDSDANSIYSEASTLGKQAMEHNKSSISHFAKNVSSLTGGSKETQEEKQRKYRERKNQSDAIKEQYKLDSIKWFSLRKLADVSRENDPLIYAPARLSSFLQFYDVYIQHDSFHDMKNVVNLVDFWSINAIKFLSGVENLITRRLLTDYTNRDLKMNEKLKVLKLHDEYFGISWSWMLAIDNYKCDIYNFTTSPIQYASYTDYKSKIGPKNHHIVHGKSLTELPFKKDSFPLALTYELWFELKTEEWVPVLSDLHRVITPNGYLHMFLMDYTIVNCKNELYKEVFNKIQKIIIDKGMDPFPCKKILSRTREAGFRDVKYSMISVKKGIPNKMGNLMEFIQSFFELAIFAKFARHCFSETDNQLFKELRMQYNQDLKNGKLLDEFGDSYFMFITAKKD